MAKTRRPSEPPTAASSAPKNPLPMTPAREMFVTPAPHSGETVESIANEILSAPPCEPSLLRESGYALIADMEASTTSRHELIPEHAYRATVHHNHLILETCLDHAGVAISVLGDGVFVRWPDDTRDAFHLHKILTAAKGIISRLQDESVEVLVRRADGELGPLEFPLRTKVLLHRYQDAFVHKREGQADDLIGESIDLAFRLSKVPWRFQAVVTEAFLIQLLRFAEGVGEIKYPPCTRNPAELLQMATESREVENRSAHAPYSICEAMKLPAPPESSDAPVFFWIVDARTIARVKGVPTGQKVFLISFTDPMSKDSRSAANLRIKVRQDYHAVILVKVDLPAGEHTEYIPKVLEALKPTDPSQDGLDAEVTVCVAAKIYGEFDYLFRVSCVDDESLRRFFVAIQHHERFRVKRIDVRQTVSQRFWVNKNHARILDLYEHPSSRRGIKDFHLILTWFEQHANAESLFDRFKALMDKPFEPMAKLHILEAGEVIHHAPVYALFVCRTLREYQRFFEKAHLNNTEVHSYVALPPDDDFVKLHYHRVNGILIPEPRKREPTKADTGATTL